MKISRMLLVAAVTMTVSAGAYAQKKAAAKPAAAKTTSAKPTKEETMEWLAGKLQENLAAPRKFVSYSNGLFVYSKQMSGGYVCTTTLDLTKITGLSNEYSEDFYMSGKGVSTTQCSDGSGSQAEFVSVAGPNFNDYAAPFNLTPDQTLVERIRKALTTLVEYNGAAKKGAHEKF